MIEREPAKADFLRHVEGHQLIVHMDEGVHRHLTFRRPETINRYFNITTWPGYLTISGDMGCYVFARTHDMFEFFCDDDGRINPSYWAEKLQATQRGSGHLEFSEKLYRQNLVSDFRSAYPPGTDERMHVWADFRRELLDGDQPHSADQAITLAMNYRDPAGREKFYDFYEHRLEDYTYHFIWCCRAIVWAIERYDEHTNDKRFPGLARLHAEQNSTPSNRAVEPRKAA